MKITAQHAVSAAVMTALCAFGPAVASAQQQIASIGTVAAAKQPLASKAAAVLPRADRAKTVSLTDLDLSTPQGVRAAHERLYHVATILCSQVADELDLSRHANYLACTNDAMARSLPVIERLAQKNAPLRGLASNLDK